MAVSAPLEVSLDNVPGIRAVFPLLAEDRLSAGIMNQIKDRNSEIPALVYFYPDVTRKEAAAALAQVGTSVVEQNAIPDHVAVTHVDADMLNQLAQKEIVTWIIPGPPNVKPNSFSGLCPGPQDPARSGCRHPPADRGARRSCG